MLKLRQMWENLRSSLWFVPGLCVFVSICAALALIEVDVRVKDDLLRQWPRLFGSGAEGARGLLSTVASSIITVVGVVYSITIVALAQASSQYSSRVLRNFMRDPVNQWVLGVMVGVFSYCLVVLRTIRAGNEGSFVPSISVLTGLLFGFVGIFALIYFIHHISASIQAAHILSSAARETLAAVEHLFPDEEKGEAADEPEPREDEPRQVVDASKTGYLLTLDKAGLLAFAQERNCFVTMERGIGDFVIADTPLLTLAGRGEGVEELSKEEQKQLRTLYGVGRQRTLEQDAAFGIRQIVDVALKALSPGINDTTTAVMCVNYLTSILVKACGREIPAGYRSEDGTMRLWTRRPTFATLVEDAFVQIRQNAGGNMAVLEAMLDGLETIAAKTSSGSRKELLAKQAREVAESGGRTLPAPDDRERFEQRAREVIAGLRR